MTVKGRPVQSFETLSYKYHVSRPDGFDSDVFVQKLKEANPSLDDLVYLKNDFDLTKALALAGVLKAFKMNRTDHGFEVYKEYFEGMPLVEYLERWRYSVPNFILLATKLTHLLKELHQHNLLVKEFIIENILVNPETLDMKICSLGGASRLNREKVRYNAEHNYYGSLWHIAPEQTGRIGRIVDHRTDFYALGIIFYQILCGRKPFYYTDSLELIHAHIAKNPDEPKNIVPEVADPFNEMVLKLMSKNAEDRYQSEEGILHDLDRCLRVWEEKGKLDAFQLGTKDVTSVFYISEKLYGRQREVNALQAAWDNLSEKGGKLYLVGGFSGIGKTRLIHEIRKPVLQSDGYFAQSKYDQLNKETALSGIVDALSSLVQSILNEPSSEIEAWKKQINEDLDIDLSILVQYVPELAQLIEGQIDMVDVGPVEGRKLLNVAIVQFFGLFKEREKKVAVFMDDLQWADSATIHLLQYVVEQAIPNILFIGAYRDNEVDEAHALIQIKADLERDHPELIESVILSDLTQGDINHLIADSLRVSPKVTEELTKSVMNKTRGNPFFVKEFLQQLVDEKIIHFNKEISTWIWDIDSVKTYQISDYVVDLLLKKMAGLSGGARQVVSLAACIGHSFDFNTLRRISGKTTEELEGLLWELLEQDFIISIGQWRRLTDTDGIINLRTLQKTNYQFRFPHDRIQQAAYSLIPKRDQQQQHYTIGQLLLAQVSPDELEEQLFDLLNHFSIGRDYIKSEDERKHLAELSLKAAHKALRNNVIRPASRYFAFGMELIREDQDNKIFKDLLIGQSECEYLLGDYAVSEELFDRAVKNARSKLNKADILCRKMALYENTQRHAIAIDTAREGLKYLGFTLPKKVTQLHVMKELLMVKWMLRNKTTDELLNNKEMTSPDKKVIMKTLMNLWGPVYLLQKQEMLAFKILKMVQYSIKYGNSIESALAYAFYGYVASAQLNDYNGGFDFAQLGMALNQKLKDKSLRSKVIVIAEGCVAHWKRPFQEMLPNLREAFHVGVESNDIIYAGYAVTFMNRNTFLSGEKLSTVINKATGYLQFVIKVNAIISQQQMLPWVRVAYYLAGEEVNPRIFKGLTDEEAHFNHISSLAKDQTLLLPMANFHTMKSLYYYIMDQPGRSLEEAEKADPYMISVPGLVESGEQIVFKVLSALAVKTEGQKLTRKQSKAVSSGLKSMKAWAESSPRNYNAKYLLGLAEQARANADNLKAEEYFHQAVQAANEGGIRFMSALVLERFAKFLYSAGKVDEAMGMYRKSIIDYHEWGAAKKVEALRSLLDTGHYRSAARGSGDITSSSLDLQSILQAAQTLSGEVKPEKLMGELMLILIKNAGAQNAYLIYFKSGRYVVEAASRTENNHKLELIDKEVDDIPGLGQSIVKKAYTSGETYIFNEVAKERDGNEDLLRGVEAKSVLCMPIVSKGNTIAVIYLDNHISKHVFTEQRLELLRLLSGQIAISLENAELYQNLEDRVLRRTQIIEQQKKELEESKRQSDELLLNILPAEVAEELKTKGKSQTKRFQSVSIIFTDFVEFTRMSEGLSPEELIEVVDEQYKAFDNITEKHGVEKIKTIGDAYMCVSGLPVEDGDNAIKAVRAAWEMMAFVAEYGQRRKEQGLPFCEMRIGIHTGPVVAGVVGYKKFAYDIWGDSVNTAARMESAGEPGKINISQTTYEAVKDRIKCSYRGKIQAKNKGEIEMYFVDEV